MGTHFYQPWLLRIMQGLRFGPRESNGSRQIPGSVPGSGRSGRILGFMMAALAIFSAQFANSQAIQGGSGAPAQAFHVSNGPRTFTVTVLGGAVSSGAVKITLPTGYLFKGGSANGNGVTATMASISANTATVNLSGIPTAGNNATFTFEAFATCAAIGVPGNQAQYVFTPAGGTAQAAVSSNAFNLLNAKINITGIAELPATAGAVGDSYVRSYRINNNGFGNIDTVYVTDVSGIGVEHVSHSVSATNNGATVDVSLVSTTTSGTNTTYLYRFIVSSTPQDDHLGQNEYFTFTQNLKIVSCSDLNTALNAWYGTGPNPQPCVPQNDTQTRSLTIDNNKAPNLVFKKNPNPSTNVGQNNLQLTCRGQAVEQLFTLKNTGGGIAKDVKMRLFHVWGGVGSKETTGGPKGDQVGFVPTSFKYKIPGGSNTADDDFIALPTTGNTGIRVENQHFYTTASCINTTAPAWVDIVVPALGPGEEIYISYQDINCCDGDCGGRLIYSTQLTQQYFNSCGVQVKNTIGGSGDMVRDGSGGNSNFFETFPTDMVSGQKYTLKWETTQTSLPTDVYPQGSTVRYQITLPPGMVYDGSPITMITKAGTIAEPTSTTYANNVINAIFTTGQKNFTSGDYNNKAVFNIPGISVDCQLTNGATSGSVNTKWFYKSRDCATCEEAVICKDRSIAYHCPGSCETGLLNDNFVVKRRNYGNPDNANNGTPNGATFGSSVRTDWVSRGDLLDFTFSGTFADAGATIHNFKYGYARFTIPDATKSHFSGASATVKITNADGSVVKADLANYPFTYTASTGVAMVDFSADKLAAAGISNYTQFANTDKVTVMITLKVSDGIGGMLATTVVGTDFYISDAPNANGANTADKYACGNFAGSYTLLGVLVPIRTQTTINLNECGNIHVTGDGGFNVGQHINNGGPGTNYYTGEYRQMGLPGNYTFTIPVGYALESMSFGYRRTSASFGVTDASVTNVTPDSQNGQVYTYNIRKFFKGEGGTWDLPDEGFTISFDAQLRPTCEAAGSSNFTYSLVIVPGTQMNETFPVDKFTVGSFTTLNLTKAKLVVNADSPIKTVTGNTVTWDVQIANTQPETTPKIWMGENDTPTNGVTIQKVEPITGFGGTVNGAAITANGTGMYELGDYTQQSKYYRITATFTNCGEDVLPLAIGYVCGNYPASMSAASCKIINNLTVRPTDGNLQVALIGQPAPTYPDSPGSPTGTVDLCQELEYTAEVKNPSQGSAYDLTFTVQKPTGVEYVPNSFQLAHSIRPAAANFTAVNNDGTYVSDSPTTLTFTIPASVVANLPYNDGYTIRYRVRTTACDFVSGTKMSLQALGASGCGSPILGTRQQSQTIRIKGENLNPNSYTITSNLSAPVTACAVNSPVYTFDAVNKGPVATYAGETIRIRVPKPFTLGATTNIANFTTGSTMTPSSDATSNIYTWTLPAGVAPAAHISFSAPLVVAAADAENLTCGMTAAIHEMITYTFEASCVPNGPACSGNLQAEGENETTTINVVKPEYSITQMTASSPSTGVVEGTVIIDNANAAAGGADQAAVVKIYHDTNGNGIIDSGDAFLGTQSYNITTAAQQTLQYSITTSYRGDLCPILTSVEPTCACSVPAVFKFDCDITLPVNLQTFEATLSETGVSLNWETSKETNSSHFEIERSSNAREWEQLGRIAASGNSDSRKVYKFQDNGPTAGLNYYRLKIVDVDQSFAYSPIRSISFQRTMLAYPNPVGARLNFNLRDLKEVASIEVINAQGINVISVKKPASRFVRTDKLPAGMYVVRVTYLSGATVEQKVVKD